MSFENNSMLELFRSEVENHSESLVSSLMALERDPAEASILETIMRSAHSLKGAAKIVGVNIAVEVAHIMEDCLVAAQRGELSIKPSDIDILLRGVDLLVQISEATKSDDTEWTPIENEVHHCVQKLKSIRAGRPITDEGVQKREVVQKHTESIDAPVVHAPVMPQPLLAEVHQAFNTTTIVPSATTAVHAAKPIELAVLTFGKTLDRVHADEMRRALLAAIKSGAEKVRYDLSQTMELDPVGLAFLAASKQQVHALALKSLEFGPVSDEIQLVLRLSGISSP